MSRTSTDIAGKLQLASQIRLTFYPYEPWNSGLHSANPVSPQWARPPSQQRDHTSTHGWAIMAGEPYLISGEGPIAAHQRNTEMLHLFPQGHPPPKAGRMMEAPCSRGKNRKKHLIVRGRFYCTHPSSRLSARPPSPGRELRSLPSRRQLAARQGTFEEQKLAEQTSEPMELSEQLMPTQLLTYGRTERVLLCFFRIHFKWIGKIKVFPWRRQDVVT